jgi:hypothetical protein
MEAVKPLPLPERKVAAMKTDFKISTRRIDAARIWRDNDVRECRLLYRIFVHTFHGNFYAVQREYGWKRGPMLRALRIGERAENALRQKELAA